MARGGVNVALLEASSPQEEMGGGRGSPGILGRDCAQSLNEKLGLYTGSSVPTREAPSLHGMLGPYLGFLVPTWDPWSLHRILGAYTGCSVPTRDAPSLLGILGPYSGCSVPTRDACSLHGMLCPHTGCSVPTRDAQSLHGPRLVSTVNSTGTHASQGVSALEEPCVVSVVHSDTSGGFKQQDLPPRPGLESSTRDCGLCPLRAAKGSPSASTLPLGHSRLLCGHVSPPALVSQGPGLRARLDDQHPSLHLQRCFFQVRSRLQVPGSRGGACLWGAVFVPRHSQVGELSWGSL